MIKENGALWAPWRKGYVIQPNKDKTCLFCRLIRADNDRKNLIVFRGDKAFIILNRFPYNNGHLLIIPNRHLKDLSALKSEETRELFALIKMANEGLKKALKPEGFNIGLNMGKAAGAGIAGHLHVHIVPRWSGDTNFMSSVSGFLSLPVSMDALYAVLRHFFNC